MAWISQPQLLEVGLHLLLPYALWLLFATYLNIGFWVLNRS